jgi:predicted transcriptional regulator
VVSDLLPFVAMIETASEKSYFIKEISNKTGVKETALIDDLKKVVLEEKGIIEKDNIDRPKILRVNNILRKVIGLYLWQKDKNGSLVDLLKIKKDLDDIVLKTELEETFSLLEKEKESLLFETELYYEGRDLNKEADDLLKNLRMEYLKKDLEKNMVLLQKAESIKDLSGAKKLLEVCQNIATKINQLNLISK